MSKVIKENISWPILLLVFQLIAVYYIKYSNQDIPISDFKIDFIGNAFILLLYLCIVTGLYFDSIKAKKKISRKFVYLHLISTWVLLIFAFVISKVDIGLKSIYLLGQQGNKLFSGILFTIFLLALLTFLIQLWNYLISKNKNSVINSIYSSVLMLLIFLLITFVYTNTLGYTSGKWQLNRNKKNIAVVLGAAVWSGNLPSPTLSGRVDKAIELLKNQFAGKILVTGSSAPGEMTEAEVALNYLLAKGIDSSFVSIETNTTSTNEQIKFIKNELIDSENVNEIIVISDAYHLPRVIEISRFFDAEIKVAESGHKLDFQDKFYNKIRESIALFLFWCFAL